MKKVRGKMVTRVCACGCGMIFEARAADVARGWGRFYSKACKARGTAPPAMIEDPVEDAAEDRLP